MNAYYDTGAIVPLYVVEAFSAPLNAYLETRAEPIPFSGFHRLELENALRLKLFRGEIMEAEQLTVLATIEEHIGSGRLLVRPVNWVAALEKARECAGRVTARTGCRTLDLIHIAVALQWNCCLFVTADDRQLAAAKLQGLDTLHLRALPRRRRGASAEPGAVMEGRAPYRASRRARRG